MAGHAVILFFSTNHAIWASDELKRAGVPFKMVPVPRHLSSDCGACLRIGKADAERVEALLRARSIDYDRCVDL